MHVVHRLNGELPQSSLGLGDRAVTHLKISLKIHWKMLGGILVYTKDGGSPAETWEVIHVKSPGHTGKAGIFGQDSFNQTRGRMSRNCVKRRGGGVQRMRVDLSMGVGGCDMG